MSEPAVPSTQSTDATELETLRRTNGELTQKAATRKARIAELEATVATLTAKATASEARIRQLTIDAPLNELCESISKAPEALRSTLESDFKIEIRDGVMTLIDRSSDKPIMLDGKQLAFEPESIKNFLLATKDAGKKRLYDSILIVNKSSGAGGPSTSTTKTAKVPAAPMVRARQFGL
jgi:hypothetical protein